MPTAHDLERFYSQDYQDAHYPEADLKRARSSSAARWLRERTRRGEALGTFLDYGCGSGALLEAAREMGWHLRGVEMDERVAHKVAAPIGAPVVSDPSTWDGPVADVLYLGDVLEHLPQLNEQMPQILRLLKPGGFLLAQGPLENNASLFQAALSLSRLARRRGRASLPGIQPPYHVMLATAHGQSALFKRFGLEPERFMVREISWPAPARLAPHDFKNPRRMGLFYARRLSQMISRTRPNQWGNWYFYAGRYSSKV